MYTSRGYRRASKENSKYSKQGQIIQKKPSFQIDNSPVVLDAYKKYFMQGKKLLTGNVLQESYTITLSDVSLSWTQNSSFATIKAALKEFAQDVFNKLELQGKFALSLELSQPDLDDDNGWSICSNYLVLDNPGLFERINEIIIDRVGNISFTQYGESAYAYCTQGRQFIDPSTTTLGVIGLESGYPTYGSPSTMKMDVYYLESYK